ncbi:hypothetical protein PG326_10065 [Riemerella anatipestifer]|nr:hypothetical protein [Riemerella anatipestifer]MDY3358664.1 hypothetical protein [Riemerella anatipestifer]
MEILREPDGSEDRSQRLLPKGGLVGLKTPFLRSRFLAIEGGMDWLCYRTIDEG